MLKAINLEKTYYTKAGASQKALDKVSLNLNNKGLVFILGKSGSGKSTLLNILGGLDTADAGEIEIKGKSSKDFSQNDFDSYRNTYLGFIFQDFNILPDFTVKENINLAYELQHKKANEEKLNEILKKVDILQYKDRKPNELSGGQIQRVAIARALIKNPDIIMADEPTGNLDSETSTQVFSTLKDLSKDKLVLVVSHDRDAAQMYADRIIELKDGKILKDTSKKLSRKKGTKSNNITTINNKLVIKKGAKLTPTELKLVNKAIADQVEISYSDNDKDFNGVESTSFVDTKTIKTKPSNDFEPFALIKSTLPNYNAFKMGASGLKHKKVKLVITLFLTIIALSLFGISTVMSSYSVASSSNNTFKNSTYNLLPFVHNNYVEELDYYDILIPTDEALQLFENTTGKEGYFGYDYSISPYFTTPDYYNQYYSSKINGSIELPNEQALKQDYVGRFPQNTNEIMINNYLLEHFIEFGAKNNTNIQDFSDIENTTINLKLKGVYYAGGVIEVTVVGMVNYDLSEIHAYKQAWSEIDENSSWEDTMNLKNFYEDQMSFLNRIIVKEGFDKANYVDYFKHNSFGIRSLPTGDITVRSYISLHDLEVPSSITLSSQIYDYLNKEDVTIENIDTYEEYTQGYYDIEDYIYFGNDVSYRDLSDNEIIVPASWYIEEQYFDSDDDGFTDTLGYDPALLQEHLNKTVTMDLISTDLYGDNKKTEESKTYTIAGFFLNYNTASDTILLNESNIDNILSYVNNRDYMYTFLNDGVDNLTMFKFMEDNYYEHYTTLSTPIYELNSLFDVLKPIFLYFSLALGLFSTFLIMNFISTSINYKKKEIGILRALGARKFDVFKVFYSEGIIMGVINYVVSMILIFISVIIFNNNIQSSTNTNVIPLNIGFLPFITVALLSFGVIFLASYIPIYKTASKKPITAIRGN